MRRRIWGMTSHLSGNAVTEIEGVVLGFLCHNENREIFQKDIETAFCVRSSTASRLLRHLEEGGFIERHPSSADARLKQVVATEKAWALNHQIEERIAAVEADLSRGIPAEEIEAFMATLQKLKQNLL